VASITGSVDATFSGGPIPAVLNWRPFLQANPKMPSYERLGILQLYEAVRSGKPFPVKAVWFSFINFLNQCAHTGKIEREIFPGLEFIVDVDLFMTPTARWADIVLPACSYLEFSDLIPHPFPHVQLQQKVIEPLYECRSDVDIAAALAERLGFEDYFQGGENALIDLILNSGHDSIKGITRKRLRDEGPLPLNSVPDLEQPVDIPFSTGSGKIEFYSEELREDGQALPVYLDPEETPLGTSDKKYPLAFIQGHSRFRTHSMFANVAPLLELNPEPLLEMNPADAAPRGISDGDEVTVFNNRGRTTLRASLSEGLVPGTVNINQGWWLDQFQEGSVNHLTHDIINPVQEKVYEPNMHMNDVAVDVVKAQEARD
jgi:molybdopterin-containing oxidoreductase family molybdopterin binding subunit